MWSNILQRNFLSEPCVMMAMDCVQNVEQQMASTYRLARMAAFRMMPCDAPAQSPVCHTEPTMASTRSMNTLGMAWMMALTTTATSVMGKRTG